ncbi:MAG: HAD-IB family hydrolase [Pseudomonadota bacterium]
MPGTAIFDLDKTITRQGTWSRFVRHVTSDAAFWGKLPFVGFQAAGYKLGTASRGSVKERAISLYLEGRSRDELRNLAEEFVKMDVSHGLRKKVFSVIHGHRDRGDKLIIASAAVDLICDPMAAALDFDDVICTRLSWDDDDRLLPRLDGENCYGAEKLRRVQSYFSDTPPDQPVTFYSDHITDLPCLLWADRGVAVNPNPPLRRKAPEYGVEIVDWDA